jgi:hypothetical protein
VEGVGRGRGGGEGTLEVCVTQEDKESPAHRHIYALYFYPHYLFTYLLTFNPIIFYSFLC